MVASGVVGRFLERRAKDEIHGSPHQFLCLARHIEQVGGRDRHGIVKRHQEVHITVGANFATRRRAKNLKPADVVLLAKRTQPLLQIISVQCLSNSTHSRSIARAHWNFKNNRTGYPSQTAFPGMPATVYRWHGRRNRRQPKDVGPRIGSPARRVQFAGPASRIVVSTIPISTRRFVACAAALSPGALGSDLP